MELFQDSMVREIPKGFYYKDSVLSHIMCDLGNTEMILINIKILLSIMRQQRFFKLQIIYH